MTDRRPTPFGKLKVRDDFEFIGESGQLTVVESFRDGDRWCVKYTSKYLVDAPATIWRDPLLPVFVVHRRRPRRRVKVTSIWHDGRQKLQQVQACRETFKALLAQLQEMSGDADFKDEQQSLEKMIRHLKAAKDEFTQFAQTIEGRPARAAAG